MYFSNLRVFIAQGSGTVIIARQPTIQQMLQTKPNQTKPNEVTRDRPAAPNTRGRLNDPYLTKSFHSA